MGLSRRLLLAILFLLFVGFAAYGSFVPFHLERLSFAEAVTRFESVPGPDPWQASRTDFLANILLFVPIGFTLAGTIADRSRRLAFAAVPLTAAGALALSIAIEFGQVFVSGRTPSWNDVTAETMGAIIGACGWVAIGPYAGEWLRPLTEASTPLLRARRLLGIYALVWLIIHLLPFDFTLRPSELAEKYRAGRIVMVPFADADSGWDAIVDVAAGVLQAIPVGALAVVAFNRPSPIVSALTGVLVIAATEFAQLLAMSRTADTTDLIAGTLGALAGGHVAYRWTRTLRDPARMASAARSRSVRPWALIALAGWLVVLVIRHWAPFDFVVTRAMFEARIGRMYQLPFQSYYWGNYLAALGEAFTKILLGVPVGALAQIIWPPPARRAARWAHRTLNVLFAAAVFSAIELGQVLLPRRYPDSTDVLLGVVGAAIGIASVVLVTTAGGRRALDRERIER